jgi:hypothetical protein
MSSLLNRYNELFALAREGKRQSSAVEAIVVWFGVMVLVIGCQILSRGAVCLIFPNVFQSIASPIVEDVIGFLPVYLGLFSGYIFLSNAHSVPWDFEPTALSATLSSGRSSLSR